MIYFPNYLDIYKKSMQRLRCGDWINLYPEGQVNKDNAWMRFYWGIGRMMLESKNSVALPFYHLGCVFY